MGDAIVRTLYRLYVSHANLLEWVPAAQATGAAGSTWPASIAACSALRSSPRWRLLVGWIGGTRKLAAGAPFRGAVAGLARHRALGEPAAAPRRRACRSPPTTRKPCA